MHNRWKYFAVVIAITIMFLANTVNVAFSSVLREVGAVQDSSINKSSKFQPTQSSNGFCSNFQDKNKRTPQTFNDFWGPNNFDKNSRLVGTKECGDFAITDENSTELVIGVDNTRPEAYASLVDAIGKNQGKIVNTVSIKGKVIAVVAEMPLNVVSSFRDEVRRSSLARYTEPNMKFQAQLAPNDPYWSLQWGPQKIEADWAWNTTIGDSSVLVAVIDTGIDYDHPDLAANYVPLGYDWVNKDADPMDDNGHGTHCAGIIAAVLNNTVGIAGLAQVRIMAEKGLDEYGSGWEDDLAKAIIDAVDQGANILSNSWGGYSESYLIRDAVQYAYNHSVLVIAAAGNEAWSNRLYPAAYDEVVAVTATDSYDNPASFTNFGDWVEVAAPGVDIYSTVWDNYYTYMSGTSMACPHVTGVAALIWSQFPNTTRDWVRAQLRYTADDLGNPGFDEYYGYGRINAKNAVEQAPPNHDLLIFDWNRPQYVKLGESATFNITVLNFGVSNETDVEVRLLVNGSLINSTFISLLEEATSTTVSLSWTPTSEGAHNVTYYVVPVPEETIIENNQITEILYVITPPSETNWMLLETDPDEGVGTNLKSIYGQVYSDIVYFKVEHYRSWTTINDIDTAIFIDADQKASTGLPDGTYPDQDIGIGADYVIVVGWEATEMWKWDPIAEWWDINNPISLAYLDAPEDSDVFVAGVFLASVETDGIVDCAVGDIPSSWDWMPDSGYFTWIVIQYEHELAVSLETPQYLQPEENSLLNATVCNRGLNNETNVEIQLLINGTEVASETLGELVNGTCYTISYSWTPTAEGIYNITAYAPPVPSENFTINNIKTKFVSVHYPLINPEPGQYANYAMNYYDSSGHLIGQQGYFNLTYEYYIEPYKIYITVWEKDPSGYIYTGSMIVNTMNRLVESGNIWTGYWYPGWIETDIDIGSTINLLDGTATVNGTRIVSVGPRAIDCWEIPYSMYGYPYTFWYDKASGLWIRMETVDPYSMSRMELLLADTNVPVGTQYEHDLGVTLDAPLRLQPSNTSMLSATVYNLGLNNESDVEIQILINGTEIASETLINLVNGTWYTINYSWTPTAEGTYNITAYTPPALDENVTINNIASKMVRVRYIEVALISDYSELLAIAPILDSMGIGYDIYNDNSIHLYTENLSLLLNYKAVIFHTNYRWITSNEYSALESYLSSGGNLLVTGFDCLVSDTLLASLVRSSSTGDNMGEYDLIVVDDAHPIMDGPYGSFPAGYHIYGLSSDCDMAEADTARNAVTVAELADGYDKIIATEGLPGKVVFWNGVGSNDWTWSSDCQAMFKNLMEWFTVRYITISINPSGGSPGTEVSVSGTKATANGKVSIYWDGMFVANTTADNVGDFTYLLNVPSNATIGIHEIMALDTATGRTASVPFRVLIITLNPSIGPVGTKVTVKGAGFTPESQATITFNDMLIGYALVDNIGNFTFAFNILVSTAETQLIKAYNTEGYGSATFTVVDITQLDVQLDVGEMHFRGEIAEFYAQTTFKGKAVNATITSAVLYKPDGTTGNVLAQSITTGLYKLSYTIPADASTGTYTLVIAAEYVTDTIQASGTSFKCFLISPTLTYTNAYVIEIRENIATVVIPDLGAIKLNLTAMNATLDNIFLKVIAINGTTATIQTTIGVMNGTVAGTLSGDMATIVIPGLGQIQADISSLKGAQEGWVIPQYLILVFALIAAACATISVILLRFRKTVGKR